MKPKIVFLQNSANLAGAQKCLLRLLTSPALRGRFELEVLVGERGWLTGACETAGVSCRLLPFPSARSLGGKLWGNARFVSRAKKLVPDAAMIHANDHPDSLLGLALARSLGVPSALTMRTPGMSRRDFEKYDCGDHDALISVGAPIFDKVEQWHRGAPHRLVHDGICREELMEPLPPGGGLDQVAVIGSLAARKGWRDLVDALAMLERGGRTVFPRFAFIGDTLGEDPQAVLETGRLRHCKVGFVGSVEDFSGVVRGFPLAIHPSRSESFGMAAIETVATGVPLLAAATGLIPSFIPNTRFLLNPGDVGNLAEALDRLMELTPSELLQEFDVPAAHSKIAADFTLDQTVGKMVKMYERMLTETKA